MSTTHTKKEYLMSDTKKRPDAYIEAPHTNGVAGHEWVWLPTFRGLPLKTYRQINGRKPVGKSSGHHNFTFVMCNNPDCGARAIVRASVIESAAEKFLPTGGWAS